MSTQTNNYRDVKAVSNSVLTEFEKNLKNFKNYWLFNQPFFQVSDDSLMLGSIIDTLLTRKDNFFDIFYVSVLAEDPAPQMQKFCKNLFNIWPVERTTLLPNEIEEFFKKAYDETGFGRDSFEKVKERFVDCRDYFNNLIKGRGKTVINNDMYQKALKIVNSLEENQFVRDILAIKSEDINGIDITTVINQLEIYSKYTSEEGGCDIPVKGALDKVIIDHNKKKVYLYDIKTSSSLNNFKLSYIKYRYFRQASFYTWLLEKWLVDSGWVDYTIEPFEFIVLSTTGEGAYRYRVSQEDLIGAEKGGIMSEVGQMKGWRELLDEICWHIKNNKWDYPKHVYEADGVIELHMFPEFDMMTDY